MTGFLVLVCRLVVGGVYIYASLDKLAHPQAFATVIHNYHLVPYALLHPVALLLPMTELVIGVALVVGWRRRGASLLAALLLLVFIFGISSALLRNLDISCGCFNTDGGHGVAQSLLWRDLGLLLLCLPPLLLRDAGLGLERLLRK